jgi:pimeloyl-ACP methyl ester carboxylesterase
MTRALRTLLWLGLATLCFACDGSGCMPPEWGASALLYPHRRPVSVTPAIPFRDLRIARDGVELRGWFFPSTSPARGTLVSLHGVGDNRASAIGVAQRFTSAGYDVLAYDSRGHGDSSGEHCTYGFHEKQDLKRMLDEVSAKPIIVFGSSLGAAVALQAAAEDPRIASVIAVAIFSDLRTIAKERAPFFASQRDIEEALAIAEQRAAFRVNDVSPLAAAQRINVPVLLIHGENDTDTTPAHSRRVHSALHGAKQLILVPGAGHTGVITPEVWKQIDAWIEQITTPR